MFFHRCIIIFLVLLVFKLESQTPYISDSNDDLHYVGKNLSVLIDKTGNLNFEEIKNSSNFEICTSEVPNLGFISGNVWVKFEVQNNSTETLVLLELQAPLIDEVQLFSPDENGNYKPLLLGQIQPFSQRKYVYPVCIFDMHIEPKQSKAYFMRIKSSDQIELPIKIGTRVSILTPIINRNFMFGIFCGMLLIMILYNLFVYFSIKDKSYLYYVIYILAVLITQATFQGYTFKYLWPNIPGFEVMSIHLMSVFVGFASVQFLRVFLQTKQFVPKLDGVFKIAYIFYALATILILLGYLQLTWILILCIVSPLSMFMLIVSIKVSLMGYKPAKFFTIAWAVFLTGVFIYAMKDFGFLPHNNFTVYTMPVGSAIETVLLSFALADRINILKKEKEDSQTKTLAVLQENDRIIKEQNFILETKVKERTAELETTNKNLKEAESNLINAEKMASLGQLTAGISHEINNPINFVVSNVRPLKRDIEEILLMLSKYLELKDCKDFEENHQTLIDLRKKLDIDYLKEEINLLLQGIDEGANRTAEIIKGLKTFARANETDIKKANVHEGIDATLSILNSNIQAKKIQVVKNYGQLPLIDCYPGKLNQVFMNLLNNAIQAINSQNDLGKTQSITIETKALEKDIVIKITDTGKGIPKANLTKIFEPFFTTKDVGEGTGLGLSIVYGIIKFHEGDVKVESEEGIGSSFIITLPIQLHKKDN